MVARVRGDMSGGTTTARVALGEGPLARADVLLRAGCRVDLNFCQSRPVEAASPSDIGQG
jgi:hypothetical protein